MPDGRKSASANKETWGMDDQLEGLVALVTGGSRRMGLAIARELASAGADIVVNYSHDTAQAALAVREIESIGRRGIAIKADVRDRDQVKAMIAEAATQLGGLDILVNNAAKRPHAALSELTLEEWHAVTGIVLDGAFLCAQGAEAWLARTGRGSIVNIGGLFATLGVPLTPHVSAAKVGLIGLSRSLATHFGPQGVTVNCVIPGSIAAADDPPERAARHQPLTNIPMRRLGSPSDIARVVRALAGPDFRYVTGQTIHVNGGLFRT
jgi:3-oxoacyl-[acyl-carrier protein] reductase